MNKKILYTQPDDMVVVVSIAPGASVDAVISSLPTKQYVVVDESSMPSEEDQKYFITALSIVGGEVVVDLSKAKQVTKDLLRRVRTSLFNQNDLDLRDAMLSGQQSLIEQYVLQRDVLRNLPQQADGANSVTELKQLLVDNNG